MTAPRVKSVIARLTRDPATRTRILQMSTVWAVLGAVVGASVGMAGGGAIGGLAGALVGLSELPTLGVIAALMGGRPKETILGAIGGLLGGLAVGVPGVHAPAAVLLLANVGLIVGAIVGSTLQAYFRLLALPITFLERFGRPIRPLAVIALRHDGRAEQPSITA
jgi:hypothetical protein